MSQQDTTEHRVMLSNSVTDFARGVTCGGFGSRGSVGPAARASSSSMLARAMAANPLPAWPKNCRRVDAFQ